jgi:ABC-type uncharacterized transport system permease subunit
MEIGLDIFLQVMVWGLYAGCIYILLATGLNLIFGVMKVVNFAHGQLLMIGAYVTFSFFVLTGFNPYVLLAASIPILIVIGVGIERLCFRPILGTGKLNEIFISIGLIYILENVAALIWTDEWKTIRSPFEDISVTIGSMKIPVDYLIIIVTTVLILVGLYIFLKKSRLGLAVRATSQNRKAAMLVGINVELRDRCRACRGGWDALGGKRAGVQPLHGFRACGQGLCHCDYRRTREHSRCDYRWPDPRDRGEFHRFNDRRCLEGRGSVPHLNNSPYNQAERAVWRKSGVKRYD